MKKGLVSALVRTGIFICLAFVQLPAHATSPVITRGPYLQSATSTSIVLRWRTNIATSSRVLYGTDSSNLLLSVTLPIDTKEHSIQLTGLLPYTKYYYAVGSSSTILQRTVQNYFITSPLPGAEGNYTFWVTGDCGNHSVNQFNVRDRYYSYIGNHVTNGWLLLGDNAYASGQDIEFSTKFFNVYQEGMLLHVPLWPVPGNHDYANSALRQDDHNIAYYDLFNLPQNGEAGGVPSYTEAYYSYDYGNIHFLALDSYGEESDLRLYDTLGEQAQWVKNDLAANNSKWVIAYWHHPPYTKGSHNSDTEYELMQMRSGFVRLLERYGVDLVLCGHSHSYERSRLMKGHYGDENSFDSLAHNLSQSSGLYDGSPNSCAYLKDSAHTLTGTVYVVSGSAGSLGGMSPGFPHNAMQYSDIINGGSMVLNINGSRLDAKWLCADGVIRDQFTIIKDANKVRHFTINAGDSLSLTASWNGAYSWSHSAETTPTVTVSPLVNTTYVVTDQYDCIADTFKVEVIDPLGAYHQPGFNDQVIVYPNPAGTYVTVETLLNVGTTVNLELYDVLGQMIFNLPQGNLSAGKHRFVIDASVYHLSKGRYLLKVKTDRGQQVLKLTFE